MPNKGNLLQKLFDRTPYVRNDDFTMLRAIRYLTYSALLLFATFALTAYLSSKEEFMLARIYELVFGAPDMGPIDFENFKRSSTPNSALACPKDFCTGVKIDFDPEIYAVSDEALRKAFTEMALNQPQVIPVFRHEQPGLLLQDRYVQRTKIMQFPDTIEVRFIALSNDTSTLAIYSRSQIGSNDFGVNLKRIREWTSKERLGLK